MDIRVEDNNLLDYSDWSTNLSGSTVNFLEYVDKSYNYRVFDTDPFGNTIPIWKTTSSGLSGWTGGIVAAPSVCGVNIDNTKIYRFSVWTKRKKIGINGRFYFGIRSLNNCSQDNLVRISDGLPSKNHYLVERNFSQLNTSMPEDIWVLVVGYVLPSTYTGSTDTNYDSKIYNVDGVNTTLAGNYKWSGTTNAVYFRTYGPYNETSVSAETYFCYPRIDLVDGTEPSINTLLQNEGMWRSGTPYIKVEGMWRSGTTMIYIDDTWKNT